MTDEYSIKELSEIINLLKSNNWDDFDLANEIIRSQKIDMPYMTTHLLNESKEYKYRRFPDGTFGRFELDSSWYKDITRIYKHEE